MNLRQQLESCDSSSAKELKDLYGRIAGRPDLATDLAALCSVPETETAASWLIKRHVERGCSPGKEVSKSLLRAFLGMNGWLARLHLLQIFQHMDLPPEFKEPVRNHVLELARDRNKFVRAWSYSALHCIACAYPEYKPETSRLIQLASEKEAPSVKARLRNLPAL